MIMFASLSVLLILAGHPVNGETRSLTGYVSHSCEDNPFSGCLTDSLVGYTSGTYGLIGYIDISGFFTAMEGTRVCFDLAPLADCPGGTVTQLQFIYDGFGDPQGQGWAGSGPVTIASYAPPLCAPFCDSACASCSGTTYASGMVHGGVGASIPLANAVPALQQALDSGADCFCLCLQYGVYSNYEVLLTNLRLSLDIACATPTPTPSPSPTASPTPTISPTPAPIPAAGSWGLLLLLALLSGLLVAAVRRSA